MLREIFGQDLNTGILREMMKDVRNYLFDPSITISVGERDEEHIFGISLKGDSQKGILVAHTDESGKLYRGDIKLVTETVRGWRPDKSIYYEFNDEICQKDTPGQTTTMNFEKNGIEVSRQITKYDNVAKTQADIISKMNIERDPVVFNVVHVNVSEPKSGERNFEAQISTKLYSLINAETGPRFAMTDDVSDLAYESVEKEHAYKYFPELKEAVTARLQGTTKAR